METIHTTGLFEHVLIQTNSQCTKKCTFCLYGIKDVDVKNIDMPDWLFDKIVNELAAIDYSGRVSLFEINEPLMDEKILDRIKIVKQKVPRSWQCISTNGDLLTADLAVQLIESGLDFLAINSYSYGDFKKAKALRKELPEYVTAKIIHTDRFNPVFAKDNRGGNIPTIADLIEPLNEPCGRINHVLYIKPDGRVVSCFGDFFSSNVMGDTKVQHIVDIWYGEQFTFMRSHLDKGDRTQNELCKKCNIGEKGDFLENYQVLPPLAVNSNKLRGIAVGPGKWLPFLNEHTRLTYVVSGLSKSDQHHEHAIPVQKYPKALTDPTIDYVFIGDQADQPFEIALKALKSGKHVLMDHPFLLPVDEICQLLEWSSKHQLIFGNVFPYRMLATVQLAKKMITEGALGSDVSISCTYNKGDDEQQRINCMDLLIYLIGEPVAWHVNNETALVTFTGLAGSGKLTVSTGGFITPQIEITGSTGRLVFDTRNNIKSWKGDFPTPQIQEEEHAIEEKNMQHYLLALAGKATLPAPQACLKSLHMIMEIQHAIEA